MAPETLAQAKAILATIAAGCDRDYLQLRGYIDGADVGQRSDGRRLAHARADCQMPRRVLEITGTSLLGELRFDEHRLGFESTVWLKINRRARRYYLHRALRICHTEGADRVTKANLAAVFRRRVDVFY